MATSKPILAGARVRLRHPEPTDAADRLRLGFDPAIVRLFGVDPDPSGAIAALSPLSEDTARQWLDALARHPQGWVVEHESRLIGDVRLNASLLDRLTGRAELAISLYDVAKLGQGLGREAIRLVLEYAFATLLLHRVGLRVVHFNERAIRCYLACGFVVEGRVREASLVSGERHDDLIMGVLASEFRGAAL